MTDIYSLIGAQKPFDLRDLNQLVYDFMEAGTPLASKNKYTIYIASKGRPNNTTATVLKSVGLDYKIVIEPQDYDSYCKVHSPDKLVLLDKNDGGLRYARKFIKQYSRSANEEKHWEFDDDLEKFFIRPRGTNKNIVADPLLCISIVEHCMDMFSNVAISGICSSAYAFSKNYAVQKNRHVYQCVLYENSISVDANCACAIEDWDHTFRVLGAGYCTLAFHHIMQQCTPTMKLPGGATTTVYAGNNRKLAYEEFIKLWPGRFIVKEYPTSVKQWRLQHIRKFFNDYKQHLILKK
jgi:hypothetical protein